MKLVTTTLMVCVAALLSLGMVMLYSSSMVQQGAHYLLMQLAWCAIGLAAGFLAALMDYRWLKKLAWPLLVLSLVTLVLVLIPGIGVMRGGARRWFDCGLFLFQPSEPAKLTLIIALAHYAERHQRQMATFRRGLVIPGVLISMVVGLIFVEPDRGTAILLAAVSGVLLLVAGVRWRCLVPPALVGLAGLAWSVWNDPMRIKRILCWWNMEEHKTGVAYQAWQAMIALGAGGTTGLGLGNGRQKLGFVPEHHTDFIFSIIGEELGLVATLAVVLAFLILVICGACIAWRARDTFGMLLGGGITFLIGLQAFINIGVVTSALPNKGLPLPFISYGGSNLLLMLVCVGLLMSIARQAEEPAEEQTPEAIDSPEHPRPEIA